VKKIMLLTWTPALWHPVIRFTSQMLTEEGYSVDILARASHPDATIPGTADFGLGASVHSIGQGSRGWSGRLDYLAFLKRSFDFARLLKPDVIVGYDMRGVAAAYVASHASPGARLLYHNLDLVSGDELSLFGKLAKKAEAFGARRADLVIFSSRGRAEIFGRAIQLPCEPLTVMNCQRLDTHEPKTGELQDLLRSRGLSFDRLVVRLGVMGPGHGIEATVESVLEWQGNWGLVLAGVPSKEYMSELQGQIGALGLEQQILLLPTVPYSLWYDCLYAADLGIALYEPGNINHHYMAGAGNKLNLYLKAGIPSLLPSFPDFMSLVERFGIGEVVDPTDPRAIACGVNAILADDEKHALLCHNAQAAFEQYFNFEKQFRPVLDWLAET